MDALKLKDLLLELIEELKIARITVAENEGRIQQLVKECHDKERKLEEEAIKTQSLKDKHEETETILSKASDDKINHLEAEKTKLQLAVDSWEKEMKALKDEVRTLQLSKYNLERTVREQQHRLQTQGQTKTSHSEQVVDIESRCKHLQKEMASYSDTLSSLKKEVTEAGVLNRMLASTNSHQKCQISYLRDEIERKQQEIIKLRVHVTERPDNANQEKIELKIGQLDKELKQAAQINQELKIQLGETKLAHQVTQSQLQESQELAERCMTSSKELTKRAAQQEIQVAALTKECALLSEQRTEASTEATGLRHEIDEWEAKKRSEMLVLEEKAERAKTECSNLKKAVLNLEDINTSWASKNQAMANDIQSIKPQMELDSQSAELDKLKVPICKFDKDTQTHSSTNDDYRYAGTSRTGGEECASNLASEKSMDGSVKGEEMQTAESEARYLQVEHGVTRETPWMERQLAKNLSSGEGDSNLHQGKASLLALPSGTAGASSKEAEVDDSKDGDTAQAEPDIVDGQKTQESSLEICKDHTSIGSSPVKATVLEEIGESKGNRDSNQTDNMDGQKPKESSSENNRDNTPIKNMPVKATPMVVDMIRQCRGDNEDSKQGVPTGKEDSHHKLQSNTDTVPLPIPGHSSDRMCLDPDKDTQTEGCAMPGQNADRFDSTTTQKTTNTISFDRFSGSLEVPANVNCPSSSEASTGNQQLPPELSNTREATLSLDKEDTSPPIQDIKTSFKMFIHDEPDACVSTAEVARSHGDAAVFGNPDKAEIFDEDIVIPSTYAEENSTNCVGEEYGKIHERETTSCDHDGSMADKLPVTTGISKRQIGLSVDASIQEGLNNNFTESTKTLPVLLIATENKSGDGKSDRTTKPSSTDISPRSEDLLTSKELADASKNCLLEKSVVSETVDTETVSVEKDGSQDIRRLRSRSRCASTDDEDRRLPATHLRGLYNSLSRKKQCTSLTTEPSYLQTPKRTCTPASHQMTSPPFVPKTATLVPDVTTAFSYFSNSEPLSVSNINALQKHSSLAKTKFTWSSPIMKKSTELGNAMSYSSWKTLEPRMQSQQQQGKAMTQTPVMFSHLPSSAQQLHQSLYPPAPSTASPKIQAVHPTSASLSTLTRQSTEPPGILGLSQWQDSVPKTSITRAKETQGVMPRLTHGRSFIDRSSDRDDQEKSSSNSKLVPDSTPTSPKNPPVPINLKCWLPPGMDQADHDGMHGGGDAGGEASLFSDEEADEDMKDGVASQIDRIQSFLKKDRLKRAKLE